VKHAQIQTAIRIVKTHYLNRYQNSENTFIVNGGRERGHRDHKSERSQMRMRAIFKRGNACEGRERRTEAGGGILRCHLVLPSTYGTAQQLERTRR
jgi:hypothetical protein